MKIFKIKRILIVLIIISLFCIFLLPGYVRIAKLQARLKEINQDIFKVVKDNRYLRQEIKALKNDIFYLEKLGREKLRLLKEGEVIYKIKRK